MSFFFPQTDEKYVNSSEHLFSAYDRAPRLVRWN